MKEREFIEQVFKKTDLNAKNIYQYNKLTNAGFYFVSCEYKELQDEVEFKYDITNKRNIKEYKNESLSLKYALIAQLIEALKQNDDYFFSIAPDNVYVDIENRIATESISYLWDKETYECDDWGILTGEMGILMANDRKSRTRLNDILLLN